MSVILHGISAAHGAAVYGEYMHRIEQKGQIEEHKDVPVFSTCFQR